MKHLHIKEDPTVTERDYRHTVRVILNEATRTPVRGRALYDPEPEPELRRAALQKLRQEGPLTEPEIAALHSVLLDLSRRRDPQGTFRHGLLPYRVQDARVSRWYNEGVRLSKALDTYAPRVESPVQTQAPAEALAPVLSSVEGSAHSTPSPDRAPGIDL